MYEGITHDRVILYFYDGAHCSIWHQCIPLVYIYSKNTWITTTVLMPITLAIYHQAFVQSYIIPVYSTVYIPVWHTVLNCRLSIFFSTYLLKAPHSWIQDLAPGLIWHLQYICYDIQYLCEQLFLMFVLDLIWLVQKKKKWRVKWAFYEKTNEGVIGLFGQCPRSTVGAHVQYIAKTFQTCS